MAEDKKGFLLYADLIHTVRKIPNEKAGELFKHILSYVNDEDPQTEDLIVQLTFEPIKQQLKRDLKKYSETKSKKSVSGREGNLKRWNEDIYKDYKDGKITLEEAEVIAISRKESHTDEVPSQPIANIADNDSVNDNDNVNDTVNDKDINKQKKVPFNFRKSLIDLGASEELVIDWLKVRKTKKASNTKTAFNNFAKQVELCNKDINFILETCIVNSWSGFKKDWLKNIDASKPITTKDEYNSFIRKNVRF